MVKLIALYTHPDDPAEFDRRYFEEHLPLARALPGLERLVVNRVTGAPRGEAPYYVIAELHFPDRATMDAALASEESRQANRSLKFAAGLVTLVFAEEHA